MKKNKIKILYMPRLFKWLGFKYKYEAKILSEPIQKEDGWSYTLRLESRSITWLNIKLKTYRYD